MIFKLTMGIKKHEYWVKFPNQLILLLIVTHFMSTFTIPKQFAIPLRFRRTFGVWKKKVTVPSLSMDTDLQLNQGTNFLKGIQDPQILND